MGSDDFDELAAVCVCARTPKRHDALRAWWARNRIAHGRRPPLGTAIVGGAAFALAANFGALELAIGALAAYTSYRMLRYGIDHAAK